MVLLGRLGRAGFTALARHAAESTSGAQAELPWRHAAARAYSAALPQLAEGVRLSGCGVLESLQPVHGAAHAHGTFMHKEECAGAVPSVLFWSSTQALFDISALLQVLSASGLCR